MDKNSPWYIPYRRYNVAFRSDYDITNGMKRLQSAISAKFLDLPNLKCGFSLEDYYDSPPFDYVFVTFKTIGPLNIPKEQQPCGLYESLNEVWFTFYESAGLKIRLQYFIQLTHGSLIEGISWTKTDHAQSISRVDFRAVKKLFEDEIAVQPLSPCPKSSYGVYDGHRNLIGRMFNYEVKPHRHGLEMSEEISEIIASRVDRAYRALVSEEFRDIVYNAMKTTTLTNQYNIKTT